jgi:hypothetical protein
MWRCPGSTSSGFKEFAVDAGPFLQPSPAVRRDRMAQVGFKPAGDGAVGLFLPYLVAKG